MQHKKIFWKVFILILSALAIMCIVSYILIYLLLPNFYKQYEKKQYAKLANEVIREIKAGQEPDKEIDLITAFAQKYGIDVILYDNENNVIFDYYQTKYIVSDINSASENHSVTMTGEMSGFSDDKNISIRIPYEAFGKLRNLQIMIPLEPLDETKSVIIGIYPIAFAGCIFFALLVALVFSNFFTKPIKSLNETIKKMSRMDPQAFIEIKSKDEIGELGTSVNLLYAELKGTIDSLHQELVKNSNEENRKIDFLRTVSHELKNPLAAANSLIEGIIYEIPPYDVNQKEYLQQCKDFLEKAIELARESLKFSKYEYKEEAVSCSLQEILDSVVSDYRIIISSKQIKYEEKIPKGKMIYTKVTLFSKVISNIFLNAVNYTSYQGRVSVYLKKYSTGDKEKEVFVIENSCKPITEEKLKELFQKPYPSSPYNNISTGLGLYIVNQLLNILHMNYQFVASEDLSGMRFEIEL